MVSDSEAENTTDDESIQSVGNGQLLIKITVGVVCAVVILVLLIGIFIATLFGIRRCVHKSSLSLTPPTYAEVSNIGHDSENK